MANAEQQQHGWFVAKIRLTQNSALLSRHSFNEGGFISP